MKIGLHMCYWWGTQYSRDVNKMIELCAKTGVDYIEMNPRYFMQLSSGERRDMRKYAEDLGIRIVVNGGSGKDADMASDNPNARKAGLEFSRRMLDAAADFGSPVWSGVMYSDWLRHPTGAYPDSMDEKKRARDYCIQSLTELGKMLDDYDIVVGMEIVNRFEQFIMNTAEEGVAVAEATGSKKIQLLLDTFHMNIDENNSADAIRYAAKHNRLAHLHAGESNRRIPCGGGNIHWEEIGRALKDIEYDKIIVMEPFVLTSADNAHRTCTWRNLEGETIDIDRMVETARCGADFLRSLVK